MKLLKFLIAEITIITITATMEVEALEILTATALHQAAITVEAAVMAAVPAATAVTTMAVIIITITTIVAITVAAVRATTATHQLPTLLLTLTTGSRYTRQYTTRL